jgi:hypothetical protein
LTPPLAPTIEFAREGNAYYSCLANEAASFGGSLRGRALLSCPDRNAFHHPRKGKTVARR